MDKKGGLEVALFVCLARYKFCKGVGYGLGCRYLGNVTCIQRDNPGAGHELLHTSLHWQYHGTVLQGFDIEPR